MLIIQTTTFGARGGIPAYNRLVCRALNELGDSTDASERRILIATDGPDEIAQAHPELIKLSLEAFSGNRVALIRRALGIALKQRIDLALIGHVNYAPIGLMLKLLQPGTRYGIILYGIEAWKRLTPVKRYALRKADFVIAISETTKKAAVAANRLDASRTCLLPNALLWADEEPTAEESVGNGTRLLSVCRLEKSEQYKGVDLVIRALPKVRSRIPDVSYLVVGSGSDLARHKELAAKVGVADLVTFAGTVNDEVLRSSYRDCDIFLMPSDAEGFGFVFLEAMHYAKAVIAVKSGATPEVVRDGETGVLVDYGNVDQLANAITSLSLDAGLRRRLGIAGQQRLRNNFSFDQFKRRLNEIVMSELTATVTDKVQGRLRTYLSRPGSFS